MKKEKSSAKLFSYVVPFIVGAVLWYLPFKPAEVSVEGWHMLAIFIGTIVGCILKPLPIGAVSMIGLTVTVLTKTVDMSTALSGFSSSSIWLIVLAFFISRGFIKTGLGRRIAYIFIEKFGKRTLGLMYAIIGCDLIIAPATPSNTARAGGIVYPIIHSLSESFGSKADDESRKKIGSYLVFTEFHGDIITSAMFLTAMAGNPLAQELAATMGVEITWMDWFLGASLPGVISLILVPIILYKIYPPEIKETPNAPQWAKGMLKEMGGMSKNEIYMFITFFLALVLWMTGSLTDISATLTGLIALSILLITKVLSWSDITKETGAWDTLVWFAVLVMMATQLNELGIISWLSTTIATFVSGFSWPIVLIVLLLAYFYSHYLFASATAHISAMYAAFLGVAMAAGVPPLYAALMLGFFGNLFASTTHFSNGPAPILFGSGYVTQNEWWRLNIVMGVIYIVIWLGLGSIWLNVIGFM